MTRRADGTIFICSLILAGIYFYATEQLPTLEIGDPLGPKAFPRLLAVALILTAGVLLIETLRARHTGSANASAKTRDESKPGGSDSAPYFVVALVAVWTFLYFLAFEPLGYVVATSIYLFALMAYFNRGKWIANALTSTLFCAGSYFMFTSLLGVSLARGILPF